MKQRMVSGIKPSGDLHIGNYLGAIRQWVALQEEYDLFLFVADLHAITVPQDPDELRRRTIEIAKVYLAADLDPAKTTLFVQSHIPEHAQLGWILNTITKNGDLTKMTQFKDKSGFDLETLEEAVQYQDTPSIKRRLFEIKEQFSSVGVGLFDYPVLMAGDILMYDAQKVPVGEDQVQHVELTRTLARRFNKRFGDDRFFTIPQPLIQGEGAPARTATQSVAGGRIMALDNPEKKMSKSATSEYSYIALMDTPEQARKKIMKAVTDSGSEIVYRDDKPALKNLINIFALLGNTTTDAVVKQFTGSGYADFKKALADVVCDFLTDFQTKYQSLSDETVRDILQAGAKKAQPIAQEKLAAVYRLVGLR
jgi:tryptophanyl-tRNA synthetase